MTKTNLLTPIETAALVSGALGETLSARNILYWSRHSSGGFPRPALDLHNKLIRFDRNAVEAWLNRFADDSRGAKRAPDARTNKVVKRARRPRS